FERDHAAVVSSESPRESSRVEIDRLEHLGVEDRRAAEEVEQAWHLVAVEENARVVGIASSHEQDAESKRWARDAGQRLDHAHWIAERTRHARELLAMQRSLGDLELFALALDDRLVWVAAARPEPKPHLELL